MQGVRNVCMESEAYYTTCDLQYIIYYWWHWQRFVF